MPERPITDYAVPVSNPDSLLAYPFRRPDGNYLTDGATLQELPDDYPEFFNAANKYLEAQGLDLLEQRAPVLCYGANANPTKLAQRMASYGAGAHRPDLQVVPMLQVSIPDAMVVWHGTIGQTGGVFSELYRGSETKDVATDGTVAFMTSEQIALLHASEGETYSLAEITVDAGNTPIKAVAYLGRGSSMLLKNGKPIQVSDMTAEEAVDYMLTESKAVNGVTGARELVKTMEGQPLKDRKQIQASIGDALGSLGLSKQFSFPVPETAFIGRADFNWLQPPHNVLHTLEQTLENMRPELKPETEFNSKPLITVVRNRAHQELKRRLG